MFSKYVKKTWYYKTVSMDEKLLLVALAELSDRNGVFITSISELKSMMCVSESTIDNLIGKLSIEQILIGTNKRTAAYRSDGKIKGKLNIDIDFTSQEANQNNKGYGNNQQPAQNTSARTEQFSNSYRSQIKSLNTATLGKTINIHELSPTVIEDWANLIMFKNSYAGQTNVWASFIYRIQKNPNKMLYSQDELIRRLRSHLHFQRSLRQGLRSPDSKSQRVKRSTIDMLEEKIFNFNFKDDSEGDH
ncbi:hypothetical protein [Candidatus Enterovibrio altilux]|uniref:hypothetical protein n=1 Tax=Candidatus Enterovibrio altilux TaxID=1927128 RepID=UPI001237A19C|nr:hypothetical protein [Candidatus Enterovibrio luxaltus]